MNFCFNIKAAITISLLAPAVLAAEPVSFKADLAPILLNQCQSCHGPKKAKGKYRVDTFERAMKVGFDELHYRITTDDEDDIMPPDADPLSSEQVALFKKWKKEGEKFDGDDVNASLAEIVPARQHPDPPTTYPRAIPITAVAFTNANQSILVSGYRELTEWSATDGKLLRRIKGLPERIQSIDFNPDHSQVVIAGGSPGRFGEVRVLNFSDGKLVRLLHKSEDLNLTAKFSPDGTKLATSGTDGTVRIFDTATWEEIIAFANHSNWVNDLAWSSDGNRIATGSRDRTAKVFDLPNQKRISSYTGHDGSVHSVMFARDGEHIFSASAEGKLLHWRARDAHTIKELLKQDEAIFRLANPEPHEAIVVVGKMPALITLDSRNGVVANRQSVEAAQLSLALSFDQTMLATGDSKGFVRVFNTESQTEITKFLAIPSEKTPR